MYKHERRTREWAGSQKATRDALLAVLQRGWHIEEGWEAGVDYLVDEHGLWYSRSRLYRECQNNSSVALYVPEIVRLVPRLHQPKTRTVAKSEFRGVRTPTQETFYHISRPA